MIARIGRDTERHRERDTNEEILRWKEIRDGERESKREEKD